MLNTHNSADGRSRNLKTSYLLILFLGFLPLTHPLEAQVDTTTQQGPDLNTVLDTSLVQEEIGKGFFAYDEFNNPIPKKSLVYSFVLPGMGQAYNRKWWKLPFVYGAVGGIVYAIDFNQGLYRRFRVALEAELNDQEHEFTGTTIGNANSLRSLRDTYDRYTQNS